VYDLRNYYIDKFTSDGKFITKWGGFGTNGTSDGQFNHPEAIAVDPSGQFVYVADFNKRIQKFDSNGKFITKWGGTPGTADGQFSSIGGGPTGIAVDRFGNRIYVTDSGNYRIQVFAPPPPSS
jgi:DNA-binding beta-propeller fold protein YncE